MPLLMGVYLLVSAGFGVLRLLLRRYDGGGGLPNQQCRLGTATPWLGLRPGRYAPTACSSPSPAPCTLVLSTQLWGTRLPNDRIAASLRLRWNLLGTLVLHHPFPMRPRGASLSWSSPVAPPRPRCWSSSELAACCLLLRLRVFLPFSSRNVFSPAALAAIAVGGVRPHL